MKSFLSSLAGSLMAIVLVLAIAGGFATCVSGKKSKIEAGSYLVVELYGGLLEYDPPGGVMSQLTGGDTETLQRVLDNLAKAEVDERIEGVILKVAYGTSLGGATMQEIRGSIARVREAGKKVYAFAESFDERDYFLLAACDEIVAPETAYINFTGLASTSAHAKRALEKLGIRPNLHKIKEYKSAAELLLREEMSEPARENTEWLFDEYWEVIGATLARDRGLAEEKILALMEHALFTGGEALEHGLVDRLMYWDEFERMLEPDEGEELQVVSQARYAQVAPAKLDLEGDKTVAVIHAQGTIAGRKSGVNPLLGLMMGHETIVAELRRVRKDEDVAAVVLRVDSPGGDALGSDLMGHEVEVTAAVKPVVVSMVDVAASGGYHISYRASRIVANPLTVTGSIGSISGKFNLSGLYDKLGISFDHVTRGPNGLMNSSLADYTAEQRARFEEDHWNGFNHWLADVADHRGIPFEEAELLAHGRVWTGRQAAANGLIDETGDLNHAIEVAKSLAEIPSEERVTLVHYPEKKGLLAGLLGGDPAVSNAARWVVYRFIRDDVARTWDVVSRDPALAVQSLTP